MSFESIRTPSDVLERVSPDTIAKVAYDAVREAVNLPRESDDALAMLGRGEYAAPPVTDLIRSLGMRAMTEAHRGSGLVYYYTVIPVNKRDPYQDIIIDTSYRSRLRPGRGMPKTTAYPNVLVATRRDAAAIVEQHPFKLYSAQYYSPVTHSGSW